MAHDLLCQLAYDSKSGEARHVTPNFRVARFFVEAKKPARDRANTDDYFQAARYAWNAGTPLAMLTNFEEFHIIDAHAKPRIDTILKQGIKRYQYSDYLDAERFAEIRHLFGREAVAQGAIGDFSERLPKPKAAKGVAAKGGEQSIDDAFLAMLDDGGWSLADTQRQLLLAKIRAAGVPLGEYVKGKIYRGVLTGLNEAFVIDASTRDRLIAEDTCSAEIIKPFLAGRDIKRYEPLKAERWLIFIPKGWTRERCNGARSKEGWFKENYPAIHTHLKQFEQAAKKRYDQGEYWWELRACEYHDEFEKPKITIPAIVSRTTFTLDTEGWYSNDKSSFIASDDLFLLGLLNSSAIDFVMRSISSTKQGGYFEKKPMYLAQLPIIADPPADTRNRIEKLVGSMLDAKRALSLALTDRDLKFYASKCATLDREIDALVWGLYGVEAFL